MPDTFQDYSITLSQGSNTLDLTITVDTSVTDSSSGEYGSNTGNPITAVSGTYDGHAITGLVAAGGYLGNDNLYTGGTESEPIDYAGVSFTAGGNDYNLFYHLGGENTGWTLSDGAPSDPGTAIGGSGVTFTITPCYVTGTLIRTTRGEVAVEDLAVGDLAVTSSGEARPIRWIGHKRVERPGRSQQPVRVVAGAFGDSLPVRDLFLSPGHAVCVSVMDEVFVPIEKLINGDTVAQIEVAEVTYWHVELESHDVLLAEGLPAESYMDAGNRAFFGREYGRLAAVDSERVAESLTRYARPFVDKGPMIAAIRQRLDARAEALGQAREVVGSRAA